MPLRISRRAYWMGLIGWLAAFWLVERASSHVDGLAEGVLMTTWAVAGVPLMCARLAQTTAPWVFGLVPIPMAIAALGAAGAIFPRMNGGSNGAPVGGWMEPTVFALVGLALFALIVPPIVIGLLPPAAGATTEASDA